ncbi:MAG: bifunctional diaminohydroxyphosphoribosylaminopyrimidine deaminase/5-amino-6-(5-phosphoribosylamino)uracil reductase RibD [Planctomycetaceae bacterium]|nr:bifunctional diaminohydroxyphosphoribosylaminopyrimidine deaminase/5-amino-6-(5-phosphoribosylamino)uracil reductase RibD [Planctomycetaceae bacterium]
MTDSDFHSLMQQALELAARGIGLVEPNPPVGAVVLSAAGDLCGTGWHQQFGGPHAEVHALRNAGDDAHGGTLYVTLEPCSHHGQTPPCADAVIAAGIRQVFVGCLDPNPAVAGRGIARLREAGIDVRVGIMQSEAEALIAPFRTLMLEHRPWVHAKWAMSLDGRIATHTGYSQWISGSESRAVVHALRGRMDAILVGSGTVLADDPLLTARPPGPRTPLRVVLDARGRLPSTSQLVQTAHQSPVAVFTSIASSVAWRDELVSRGVEVLVVPAADSAAAAGPIEITAVLAELGKRRCTHLLVEGGQQVLGSFHDAGLIDEVHVFIAPKLIGGAAALSPLGGIGKTSVPEHASLERLTCERLGDDSYLRGRIVRR